MQKINKQNLNKKICNPSFLEVAETLSYKPLNFNGGSLAVQPLNPNTEKNKTLKIHDMFNISILDKENSIEKKDNNNLPSSLKIEKENAIKKFEKNTLTKFNSFISKHKKYNTQIIEWKNQPEQEKIYSTEKLILEEYFSRLTVEGEENKNKNSYQLTMRINNYIYLIGKFILFLRFRSFNWKNTLYLPLFTEKKLMENLPNINAKIEILLRNFIVTSSFSSRSIEIEKLILQVLRSRRKNLIINLLIEGILIITNLNFLILRKKKAIKSKYKGYPTFKVEGKNLSINKSITNLFEDKKNLSYKDSLSYQASEVYGEELSVVENRSSGYKYSPNLASLPISLNFYSNIKYAADIHGENLIKKPILSHYLKEMSIYNMKRKGILIFYYILIGFHFNTENNKIYTSSKNMYKLLAASFKSMYCLISKPVFVTTPDKIIVQLFYYLFIPNILKLKKFFYNKDNSSLVKQNKKGLNSPLLRKNKRRNLLSSKRNKSIKKQYYKFRKIKLNVRVKLRKLSNISLAKVFPNKFKFLSLILNNIFKRPVEFDLIRTHYPYSDSNILVNLLGIMINKIKLRIIIRRFFEKAIIKSINNLKGNRAILIPSFLSGLTIKVAGRVLTQKVVPKKTVKTINRGATATGKINYKDVATYTNKNKRGAFSITVKAGQTFF